jgi:hypothetical protein
VAPERCPRCSARRVERSDTCARCQWRFAVSNPAPLARPIVATPPIGSRCPNCSRFAGPDAAFCPHCGVALGRTAASPNAQLPKAEVVIGHGPRPLGHRIIRLALTIWLIAYPVVACTPVVIGSISGGAGGSAAILGGLFAGGILLGPWLIGILVLGLLALLTR